MMQGDIYYADLNPIRGSEQTGKRPVLIISGNTMNRHFPVRIICPLSTTIKDFSACSILTPSKLNGLKKPSQVLTFHIRAISKERLGKKIGSINTEDLVRVFRGLSDILRY